MPNILLTQCCVRSCPYCFAKKHMTESSPDDVLSWENLIYLADFLQTSGQRRFSILGGEPTLHPEFNSMVLYLLERNFDVTVFTCGIMADRTLEEAADLFRDVHPDKLAFVCNLNNPDQTRTPLAETESVKRFLKLMGERVTPGFNIYRLDFELEFLFRYVNEYGLRRTLRIGVTHPIPGRHNRFIAPDKIKQVVDRLYGYAPLFERFRIKPGFDCGFPMCEFSDAHLAWLYRHTGGQYDFGCNPVIDIGPDMMVWACFPLSDYHKKSVFEFDSLDEIHQYYMKFHDTVRTEAGGIFEACDSCVQRDDRLCRGGCLAHSLAAFQKETPVRMGEVYP